MGLLGIGLLFARSQPDSYDAGIMLRVAISLAHGSITVPAGLDAFGINSPHASYGIGTSLVMLALYGAGKAVHASTTAAAMTANSFLFALTGGLLVLYCRLVGLRRVLCVGAAVAVCLTTPLLAYTATGFSEMGVAAAVALGLVGLAALQRGAAWGGYLVGAAIGLATLFRSDSLLLVAPFLFLGALWIDRRSLGRMLLAGAPPAVVWLAYNAARFGAPWDLGYEGATSFNHPFARGLYGLVISPGKGIAWYAPLLLATLFALPRAARRARVLTVVAAALLCTRILFYAFYWGWNGGGSWGPRLLVPALPALIVLLAELVRDPLPRPAWVALAAVTLVGFCIQVVGATVDYNRASVYTTLGEHPRIVQLLSSRGSAFERLSQTPVVERIVDDNMFNWRLFPVVNEGHQLLRGENVVPAAFAPSFRPSRVAVALVLVVAGCALCVAPAAAARRG
jgi:hypothetical protein